MPVDEAVPVARGLRRAGSQLALAVSFLTILPVRVRAPGSLGGAAAWFPAVGALIGALAGGVRYATEPLVGPAAGTVLAMATLVVATGALHQDGLADTADGLGVRGDRERRLAVMRDSATGAFGTLALFGWSLLLLTALQPLSNAEALAALVAAAALGRWAALVHAAAAPPARPDGLGAGFTLGRGALLFATACAVAIAGVACGPLPGLAALGAALAVGVLSALAARRLIGGRTGDTIGATVALVELAVCTTLLAVWR
ncbi:MAG: adenosylcobinamide-GDP ribazoletransferase [Thermoleophilaceae bacterium]|nr:adenosylcobinamide-GDP ribazoletransferase [Thermoleophilaceae bacterium]